MRLDSLIGPFHYHYRTLFRHGQPTEIIRKDMWTLALSSCVVLYLRAAIGSIVNFEDAQRLMQTQTNCRMRTLESWHGGRNFDLFEVERQWKQMQKGNETKAFPGIIQRFNTSVIKGNRSAGRGGSLILYQLTKMLQDKRVIQRELRINRTREEQLQVALNACEAKNRSYRLYASLQSLISAGTKGQSIRYGLFKFGRVTQTWSQFWSLIRSYWSRSMYMTESQEYQGYQEAMATGIGFDSYSQFYLSYVKSVLTGSYRYNDARMSRYLSLTRLTFGTWYMLNEQQRSQLLMENGIVGEMGIFGYLVLLAELNGLAGPVGRAFNLRQPLSPCQLPQQQTEIESTGNATITTFSGSSGKDIFLLVAQSLLSRDVSSLVKSAIHGNQISHNGHLYRMDAFTGQLVSVADLTPPAAVSALLNPTTQPALASKIQQSQAIDTLLCVYGKRMASQQESGQYFRDLRAWYSFGRVRGLEAPTAPLPPLNQCAEAGQLTFQNGTSSQNGTMLENAWERLLTGESIDMVTQVSFDVESKLERLCTLRKANLISSSEYEIIREMISDYANTSVIKGEAASQSTTKTSQSSLVDLLGRLSRSPYRTPRRRLPPSPPPSPSLPSPPPPRSLFSHPYFSRQRYPSSLFPRKRCLPKLVPIDPDPQPYWHFAASSNSFYPYITIV